LEGGESGLWAATEMAVGGGRLALVDGGAADLLVSAWKCVSFKSRIFIVGRFKLPSGWWRVMSILPVRLVVLML
jgi:hypothetical protein